TNIGLLFTVDPAIPTLLKGIVTMAGNFLGKIENAPNPEWNAMGDAHASRIVYDQAIKQHRSIGLDVTMQVTMTIPEFRAAFDNDRTRPLLDFAEIWFHEWPVVTFHDPLAAATIFKPELCEYEKGEVLIEINDPENCGWTHWQPNANGRHEIATTVNRDSFIAHYFSILENF
ncbi:MAG: nucleoside hydrolase, partial [Candidatus Marinimicrobia bacterium]|nr:nucleoside hydrolase [Candidatus Neomarinimicrobiota bacterium]